MSVFDHLPAAVRARLPALDGWDGEPRATCERCPMAASADDGVAYPWSFSPETRCCTAHPRLANFLAGRALAGGGRARDLVIARLGDPLGVSAAGIGPSDAYDARYRAELATAYGRDVTMRCPFWVGGERSCGVWADRPSLCRAWSCRHEHGLDGGLAWRAADDAVTAIEGAIAALLVARGAPPAIDPWPPVDAWVAWFEACAAAAAELDGDDPEVVALAAIPPALISIRRTRPALPARPTPAVSDFVAIGDGDVLLAGYSTFDPVRAPRAVFALLARLDGATDWRDALAAARAALGGPAGLDEALVRELYRIGAVG